MNQSEKTPRDLELERIEDNHAKHRKGKGTGEPNAEAPADSKGDQEPDFDDHATQERILHPEGTDVALSYGTIKLYPPSALVKKLIAGFCHEILADSSNEPSRTEAVFISRVASKVMSGPGPMARLFRLTAYLCGKPGTVDDKTALEISTELMEKTDGDDVIILFTEMLETSGIRKKPNTPKK